MTLTGWLRSKRKSLSDLTITYLAKILSLRLEQSGREGASIGPHFDRVVCVADAPLDAVDDEVGVELGVHGGLVEDGGHDGEGDQRLVQHPHVAGHEHRGEVGNAAEGHDRFHHLTDN